MENLYTYLKEKLKSKNIRSDELAKMCGFSKSTLYRYMKTIQPMPKEIEQKICEILELNNYEQKEFHKILENTNIDETLIKVREVLYKSLFNFNHDTIPKDFELILYDGDRYIRTLEEIFNIIIKSVSNKGFLCEINMIGCIDENVIYNINRLIKTKGLKEDSVKIEHIINISNLYDEVIETFITLFPLLQIYNYNIFYTSHETDKNYLYILDNFMIIKYNYIQNNNTEEKYIFISFFKEGFSDAYVSKDKNLYSFFIKNYTLIKDKCNNNLIKLKNSNIFNPDYENIEKNNEIYVLQTTPSYQKIPMEVIYSELKRYNEKQLIYLANLISDKKQTISTIKDTYSKLIDQIEKKYEFYKQNKNIDIYTKEGIKNFITTGKLDDHINGLLPFSKESINIIMKGLITRDTDPKSNYYMYILNDSIPNQIFFKIIKKCGLFIKYNFPPDKNILVKNLYIVNEIISKIFTDFIENHILKNVMSKQEAYNYINKLLNQINSK